MAKGRRNYVPKRSQRSIGTRVFERRRRKYQRRGRTIDRYAPSFWYDTEKKRFYASPLFTPTRRMRKLDIRDLMVAAPSDFRVRKNGDVYFRGESLEWNIQRQPNPPARLRTHPSERLKSETAGEFEEMAPENKYYEQILAQNGEYEIASMARNKRGHMVAIFRNARNGKTFSVNTGK